MQERIGVIDLGSNTTRLMVMGYTPHHSFKLLDEVRETVRLAEGLDDDGRLKPAPMERGIEAMKLFHSFCRAAGVQRIVPVATSAVRDAINQAEFLLRVERESGLKLRVLSTEEEAYYGYLGAANALDLRDAFLIDIGGGSTELVIGVPGEDPSFHVSMQAGAVRQTERHV
ncbi:MAG: Ppx/GppA phosphatase family protein, partial [Roseiflexaceae bacterium]